MTDPKTKPPRGSFPKGPPGETIAQRRERYEQFVPSTHSRLPDYEAQSIRFYRGRTKLVPIRPGAREKKEVPAAPSRRLCATSRCWQCEAGDDDSNAAQRIGNCRATKCGLWPVRPYQEFAATPPAPTSRLGDYIGAIRKHCLDCVGGNPLEVRRCTAVTCALFPARAGASNTAVESKATSRRRRRVMTDARNGPASPPEGPASDGNRFPAAVRCQGPTAPALAANTPVEAVLSSALIPPGLAAFLDSAPSRVAANVLGVSQRRVNQLRQSHCPRLSQATLRRWEAHIAQEHPLAGRWVLRRVRNGAVQIKGQRYPVPPAFAANGQQLNAAPTRAGALLIQALAPTAACFVVHPAAA